MPTALIQRVFEVDPLECPECGGTMRVIAVTPAECRQCGFEFSPDKFTKPSKRPECRSTWIREPFIEIRKL